MKGLKREMKKKRKFYIPCDFHFPVVVYLLVMGTGNWPGEHKAKELNHDLWPTLS